MSSLVPLHVSPTSPTQISPQVSLQLNYPTESQASVIHRAFATLRDLPSYVFQRCAMGCRSIKAEGGLFAYLRNLVFRCKDSVKQIWKKPQATDSAQEVPADQALDMAALTPTQKALAEKLQQCTISILTNVFQFFMHPKIRKMSPVELGDLLKAAQEERAPHIEERTAKFMQSVVSIIEEELNQSEKLSQAFTHLAETSGDPLILNKIIEGISYPFIKKLIEELDREYPSYVDSYLKK